MSVGDTGLAPASTVEANWFTRDVFRILVTQVVFGFGWSLYLLIPKFLAATLHAPPDVIGRIAAMGGLAGLFTVPFAARGLDRMDRRVFFRIGAGLVVIASVGFTFVERVTPLVYLLQGAISASFVLAFNATAALMSDYAPPSRLGQAIGWLGGANVGMNAVAALVAEPLAARYGWDAVFALGVIAGGAAFGLSFSLRNAPARVTPSGETASAIDSVRRAGVVPLLAAATLMGAVFIAMFGFMQPYAVSLGGRDVASFFVGFTVAALAGRILLGGLGDRIGRRRVSVVMLAGYASAALFMRELKLDWLFVYGLAFGSAHGVLYPTMNALLLELLPGGRRGLGMVLYNGAFNLGASTGSLGWGLLAKLHGYPTVYVVAAGHAFFAAAILVARPGKRPGAGTKPLGASPRT